MRRGTQVRRRTRARYDYDDGADRLSFFFLAMFSVWSNTKNLSPLNRVNQDVIRPSTWQHIGFRSDAAAGFFPMLPLDPVA
ncbi:hypothetical protein [Bradyrhizobium sp. 142]|uniref:hypothetical protein n=1 Tax=Bradyrhizobium sp. 142 TaxID=2782618 RepID=UPI001FFBAF50|nr:hypothetical protein [Bradyrhizobium sp. 142]MCK1727844.1 hypothetical protein [Bradyrhizobium sp. 142]